MLSIPSVKPLFENILASGLSFPVHQTWYAAYFKYGYLLTITLDPYPEEQVLIRFAKVFNQAYTRFLDLQKAEEQAREAEIELSLERVRARAMAMQKSEELADLSLELVKQVQALGVATWFCAFNIYDDEPQGSLEWGSNGQGTFPKYRTPREGIFLRYYEAGQRGETLLINEIGANECPAHYEYLCSLPGVGDQLLKMKDEGIPFPASQIDHIAFFKYGYILFISYDPVPESHDIFKRFAKVFEQTYTRFLDLKRAEAQARESEIQLALEKSRMVALGLNKSDEMLKVAKALYEQLLKLGFPNMRNAIIDINNGDDDTFIDYDYSREMSGTITQMSYHDDATLEGQFKKMSSTTNDIFELVLEGKELEDLIAMRIKNGEDEDTRLLDADILTYNLYSFGNGAIGISNFGLLNEDEKAMTSGDGTKIGMIMTLPRHIHGDIKLVADWEKSNEPTVVLAMDTETAVDYIHKMITLGDFKQVDPQAPTLDDIRHIGGLTFVMARTKHGEIGFSLPGTVPDPPKESMDTLVRFAGVDISEHVDPLKK